MTENKLGTERIPRLFVMMAMPVVLQQFIMLLNSVIDRLWIAHIPEIGELAFTGSSICIPIIYIILALAELVGTGIAPRVGYLLGQGNRYRAEQTLGTFLFFDLLLAVLVCVVIEWQCVPLVQLFGGSDQTRTLAELYLRISTPGNALCLVSVGMAPFLLAQGRSTEAGAVLGSGIVLNMLLTPLLIFGFGWGLAGAAWATTIADTTAAVLAVGCLCRKGDIRLHTIHLRLNWRLIGPCLALGVTPMVMMLAETIQMGVYNRTLYEMVGDVGVGTMALVIMLHDFLCFPVYGMSFGVQSVTSYNLGAGLMERVRENVWLLLKATLVWSVGVWLVMMLLTGPVVRLVVGDGPMADYAVPMVRLAFVVFFVATAQFACQSTLQAMNRPVVTFWLGLSRTLLLLVPMVWLLPRLMPSKADAGVFLAQPVTDVLVLAVTVYMIYKLFKNMNCRKVLIVAGALLCSTAGAQDQRFENPPQEARPYVWWHWINGNTSKDGIRKDLEWMNRIGIAGFHQFDAGGTMMQGLPPVVPQTPYLSDAWKENFAYAIHLADSLGMEVGIASAPGWSSTGGPWVEPADAMKKLTWRTLEVKGNGKNQTLTLPEPYKTIGRFQNVSAGIYAPVFEKMPQWYQDIAVVAVRVPEAEKSMQELGATITTSGGDFTVEQLTNGDINDGHELAINKEGTHAWIQYNFPEAVTIRSFTLVGGQVQGQFDPDRTYDNTLLCSQDGKTWTEVIRVPSSNLAQITVDIPETTAKHFRLTVINPQPDYSLIYYGAQVVIPTGTLIHEWKLNTVYKVNHAEEKAGFASPGDLLALPSPTTDAPVQETIDLTDKVKDGVLTWKAPAGKWRIYRFGASLTGKQNHPAPPEATGLEVDKLDADAWNRYFHTYLDMYKNAANGLLGERGIQYLMIDSYEAEHMTWTPNMEQAFKTARGYDLRPWLPALTGEIIGSSKATEDFLFDWRETIGELFAANYDRVNDILREYGMKGRYTESHENARTFVGDGMDPKRTATVPMAAIWTVGATESVAYQADIRESASTAHIYGQNIVAGESFTTNGMLGGAYTWYPGNLKEVADVALMSGLNRFFIHESTHQPSDNLRPGLGLLIFGQWFSRHETWAEYAKYWLDYLARSSYYLQAGRNVADVLWFYGEDTNIASAYGKALPDVPESYNYDFCSPHALLHCISPKDYQVVALGEHAQNMSIEILRKLHQLVSEGVYLIGKEPVSMAGQGGNAAEFEHLKADIWHANRTNVWTGSVAEGLKHSGVAPDFQSSILGVRFVHRMDGERNIYWVRNFSGKEVDTDIVLRDAKGTLTVMDPVTGKPVYDALRNGKLHLGADDALFVVADPNTTPVTGPAPLKSAGNLSLDGPWTVSFEGQDAPEGSRTWQTLSSLTESDEPDVKYFSGTATYQNTFTLSKKNLPAGLSIDLGEVGQMADVFINGEHVDFLWNAPYKVNFVGYLKPGKNTIEVKVVNTWVNRLIGDGQPDVEGHSFTPVAFYGVKSLTQNMGPVIPSGLMGPVRLELLRYPSR